MALLKEQRNSVLLAIRTAGFDPRHFEWHCDELLHPESDSYFRFGFMGDSPTVEFAPAQNKPTQELTFVRDWDNVLTGVSSWLKALRREHETPDLWAELSREARAIAGVPEADADNRPFEPDELRRLTAQLHELREYVAKTYELSEEQNRALEARLAYLEEAAARLGRRDWWQFALGTLLGAVVEAVIPPEPIREVILLLARGLAELFGGAIGELPSG